MTPDAAKRVLAMYTGQYATIGNSRRVSAPGRLGPGFLDEVEEIGGVDVFESEEGNEDLENEDSENDDDEEIELELQKKG
jgi:hypothetical protein